MRPPDMDMCVCNTVRQLAADYDEDRAKDVIPALNSHLRDLQVVLSRSKSLTRSLQYQITSNNKRTKKALLVDSIDLAPIDQVCETFREDIQGFWTSSEDSAHIELRRRLACVVIFLRSQLDPEASIPPQIARLFQKEQNYADLRHYGRKYIKISRKLGGLGAILWLPLNIPAST